MFHILHMFLFFFYGDFAFSRCHVYPTVVSMCIKYLLCPLTAIDVNIIGLVYSERGFPQLQTGLNRLKQAQTGLNRLQPD